MKNCNGCIFAEGKNTEFLFCKNLEKHVDCSEVCSKFITNTLIINTDFACTGK